MPDPRRFQPRRSTSSGFGRRVVIGLIAAVAVILLIKTMFGGHGAAKNTKTTNEPTITLINDVVATNNANVVANTNTVVVNANSNSNVNTNSSTNTNTATVTSGSVKTICPRPLSQFGSTKNIALTFDLAADNVNTTAVLQALKDGNAPATFFVSGTFADKHPETIKTISQSFEIANHGYDVSSYSTMTAAQATSEISKGAAAIKTAIGGGAIVPYFRPPFGNTSDILTKAATDAGDCTILWTVDVFDWQNGQTVAGATQRAVDKFRSGAILLLHAGYDITPDTVKAILTEGHNAGYSFVTISQLVGVGTR